MATQKELYEKLKIRYLLTKGILIALDKSWILKIIEADGLDIEKDDIKL